ncbi:MAG: hypothetical protein P8Q54_03530 [Akkermansiaceae bacterium]|nr:hypothetical protein [Akkermansiaceae bacterium]
MKTKIGIAVTTATMVATIHAETIVKWGGNPADTEIVTANAKGINQFGDTYDHDSIGSPEDGTSDYLLGALGQTRTFYGAMSTTNTVPIVNNSGRGDRIQMVHNFRGSPGSLTSMVVWKADDFLVNAGALDSMTVSFASRGGKGTTIAFLIETSSGWFQSDQTASNDSAIYADFSETSGSLTWSPFSEFSVSAGADAPDLADIQSVGVFSSSTNVSSNFIGGLVAYFEVTAGAASGPSLGITSVDYDEIEGHRIDFTGLPNTVHGVEFSPDLDASFVTMDGLTATTDSSGVGVILVSSEESTSSKGFFRIISTP